MDSALTQWLNTASKAPSGDNCQPWDIAFFPEQLRISINAERAHHFLDQDQSASWIALGAFCENLLSTASHFGFRCSWQIESKNSVVLNYSTTVPLSNPTLIQAIHDRQTYRVPLGATETDLIKERQLRTNSQPMRSDFSWQRIKKISWRLLFQWAWVEAKVWLKTPLMQDFTRYLHTRPDSKMVDGLTLDNLKVSPMDALMLRICKHIPAFIRLTPFPIFLLQVIFRMRSMVKNSAGLIYLSGRFQGPGDYFDAGREIQRMWLLMTEKKIKAQPLAIQSLFLNFIQSESTRHCFTPKELEKFSRTRTETFRDLGIKTDLIFIFRFGTSSEKIQALPRRPISPPAQLQTTKTRSALKTAH